MAHSFGKFCIDPAALVAKQTLAGFMAALTKQSNTKDALIPYREDTKDVDDSAVLKAPSYFGAGGEFLCEAFFEIYGHFYNAHGIYSYDDEQCAEIDGGIDHLAYSIKKAIYSKRCNTQVQPGSPIYIQTKTVVDPTRVFKTNDGSRLMNFFGHAQAKARAEGLSYQARYILFTTGDRLHHILDENTFGMIEVINYKAIKKRIDNDQIFWNHVREKFGLDALDVAMPSQDAEYKSILIESEETID